MTDQFVEQNKVVSFVYSIVDESGELLEQSDLPISYVHGGKHDLFEKVEQGLDGAVVGDTVEVSLTPEEGFGAHDPGFDLHGRSSKMCRRNFAAWVPRLK